MILLAADTTTQPVEGGSEQPKKSDEGTPVSQVVNAKHSVTPYRIVPFYEQKSLSKYVRTSYSFRS